MWCVYVYICTCRCGVKSTDYPLCAAFCRKYPSFLRAFLQVHVKCTCFRFHFQRLYVFAQEIFLKKKLQKRIFGSPLPRMHPSPCVLVMICILVHAETERITEFSFSRKPIITIRIEENSTRVMELKHNDIFPYYINF